MAGTRRSCLSKAIHPRVQLSSIVAGSRLGCPFPVSQATLFREANPWFKPLLVVVVAGPRSRPKADCFPELGVGDCALRSRVAKAGTPLFAVSIVTESRIIIDGERAVGSAPDLAHLVSMLRSPASSALQ